MDGLQGWESELECRDGLSEGCPEGSLDKKEGFDDHFWYLELKFGIDLLSTGHLSRLFDPATGSLKMQNHFPVILALLILYQLPYGAEYLFQQHRTHVFPGKLIGFLWIPKRASQKGLGGIFDSFTSSEASMQGA